MSTMETAEGATPLMAACHQGNLNVVKKLLANKKCDVRETDLSGRSALHYCIENTDTACSDALLIKDKSLVNLQDGSGYTALHLAVIGGNSLLVSFLIDNGANVNSTDNEKHNSVHWATVCGQLEILELLLKKRATVSSADVHGAYPIHYAAQMCGPSSSEQPVDPATSLKILKKILYKGVPVDSKDNDGRQPLLWAASAGASIACEELVKAGASVDVSDTDGLTALHCAASRGHSETVESLVLKCHLPVDTIDKNKCTALFYGITMGHIECARVLLDLGTDGNHRDRKGRSPAHCAASKGSMSALILLKEKSADLWIPNNSGDLPIHEAALNKYNDMVKKFISTATSPKTSLNAANHDRRACLHIAATTDNLALCKILVGAGAQINPLMLSKNKYLTPYDTAVMRENKECAAYLRRVGGTTADKVSNYAAGVIQRYTQSFVKKKKDAREAPPEMEVLSEGNDIPEIIVATVRSESVQTSPVAFYVEPVRSDAGTLTHIETVDSGTSPRSEIRSPSKDIVSKVQLSVLKYEVPRRLAREMQVIKKQLRDAPRKYDKAILHQLKVEEVNLDDLSDLESCHDGSEQDHEISILPSPLVVIESETSKKSYDETDPGVKAEHRKQASKHEQKLKEEKEMLENKMSELVKRTEEMFNTVSLEAARTLSVVKQKNRGWEQHISAQRFVASPRTRKPHLTPETKQNVSQEKSRAVQTRIRHRDYQAKRARECREKVCSAYGQQFSYLFNEKTMLYPESRSPTPSVTRPRTSITSHSQYSMSPAQLKKVRSSKHCEVMTQKGVMRLRNDDPMPALSWLVRYDSNPRPRHDLQVLHPTSYNKKVSEEKRILDTFYNTRARSCLGQAYMTIPIDLHD